MNLTKELKDFAEKVSANASEEKKKIMQHHQQAVLDKKIESIAKNVGDIVEDFTLPNATGEQYTLSENLGDGFTIINFYRGGWCPYCNLELRGYQESLEEINSLNGTLIAISPEVADESLSVKEKHELEFEVLSDENNVVAKQFGLVFKLEDELVDLYKTMGIDLIKSQGNESYELPIPATYIVDSKGVIQVAFLNSDYKQRLDPSVVVDFLKENFEK